MDICARGKVSQIYVYIAANKQHYKKFNTIEVALMELEIMSGKLGLPILKNEIV